MTTKRRFQKVGQGLFSVQVSENVGSLRRKLPPKTKLKTSGSGAHAARADIGLVLKQTVAPKNPF